MNETRKQSNPEQPNMYQIRLQGHLSSQWVEWFDGLTISLTKNGDTLLTGPIADQAALFGLLRKVRDAGLPLLAVTCLNQVNVPGF
jgi:hypothetical protein